MGLTKKNTHAILKQRGVRRPWVYEIGMPNGNCIGCVKSSSPNYWALIRKWFPEVFERRNNQARRFGARPVILRSEEHTSELQSLMRISYAVFCLKKKKYNSLLTLQV